jgi:hypothetical protein
MSVVNIRERIIGLVDYAKLEGHSPDDRDIVKGRVDGYISCAYENSLITRTEHDSYMDRLYSLEKENS